MAYDTSLTDKSIESAYDAAKSRYAAFDVDTADREDPFNLVE